MKAQRLFPPVHMFSRSIIGDGNWAYFCSMDNGFRDTDQFPNWDLTMGKMPEVVWTVFSFYPKRSKLSLSSLYGHWFPRPGLCFFENCHIWAGNLIGTCSWQSSRSYTYIVHSLSTIRGRNWAYLHYKGSGFRDKDCFSKLPYLGINVATDKKFRNCTYTLSTPGSRNADSCFSDTAALSTLSL